jgi:hypothetical protein
MIVCGAMPAGSEATVGLCVSDNQQFDTLPRTIVVVSAFNERCERKAYVEHAYTVLHFAKLYSQARISLASSLLKYHSERGTKYLSKSGPLWLQR